MAGGDEADFDLAEPDRLSIGKWIAALRAVAAVHDRQRLRGRPDRAVAAARMIAMAVGDERSSLGPGRVDPGVGRGHVNAFGERLHPGTETGHGGYMASMPPASQPLPAVLAGWFAGKGWSVRRHQLEMLAVARAGRSALLVAPTGAGKTLAGFLPTLAELVERPTDGLHTLYISPLKALAVDVQRNLLSPVAEMALPIRVEPRTGDTPADRKARQRVRPPQILLTTPESLSLLLSHEDSFTLFGRLSTVVVDEVHAFASGKRGDLLSLSLARLQKLAPAMRRVALSATVADPEAYQGWLAPHGDAERVDRVIGDRGAEPQVGIMLPEDERIPWSGHSGRW